MALESLSDTPPPLVSKGNNDSDTPANNSSLIEAKEPLKAAPSEGSKQEIPAEELEDGEIEDRDNEEAKQEDGGGEQKGGDSEEWDVDPDEARRIKKRQKNRERRKRKKEKRMQALQAWAMAMAAGEMMGDQQPEQMGGIGGEEDMGPSDEEEKQEALPSKRNFSPKRNQKRKRVRAPSPPSESEDEEFSKLLKQEMSRHQLKPRSSDGSSPEDRRFDSGGDAPINVEDEETEEEYETSHRSKKKKWKKPKHHHRKHSKKLRREQMMVDSEDEEEDGRMLPPRPYGGDHHQDQDYMQGQQGGQQEPMSEQDHQMGKVHVPKTHLICKFFLENKCKKVRRLPAFK